MFQLSFVTLVLPAEQMCGCAAMWHLHALFQSRGPCSNKDAERALGLHSAVRGVGANNGSNAMMEHGVAKTSPRQHTVPPQTLLCKAVAVAAAPQETRTKIRETAVLHSESRSDGRGLRGWRAEGSKAGGLHSRLGREPKVGELKAKKGD